VLCSDTPILVWDRLSDELAKKRRRTEFSVSPNWQPGAYRQVQISNIDSIPTEPSAL
jgi:hypothetical protein